MIRNADSLKSVKRDLGYKWIPIMNKMVYEGVKGPLIEPMFAIPFPCSLEDDSDDCEDGIAKCSHRGGIPDPWNEYVVVNKGCLTPAELPKKDVTITKHLWQNYHMDFGQGIPDPWKRCIPLKHVKGSNRGDNEENLRNCENFNTEKYDTPRINCPTCSRGLLVFCLKDNPWMRKRRKGKSEEEKRPEPEQYPKHEADDGEKPYESPPPQERVVEEKKPMKDASIETDEVIDAVKIMDSFENTKTRNCPKGECCKCNIEQRQTKPKVSRYQKDDDSFDSTNRKQESDVHMPICVHNFLPFLLPNQQWRSTCHNMSNEAQPRTYEQQYPPMPYVLSNSQFPIQSQTWFSPRFFVCGDKKGHFYELKWICRKCEKEKKRRRKRKPKPEYVNHHRCECLPCPCMTTTDHFPHRFDDDDLDFGGIYKISRVRKTKPQIMIKTGRSRCHCDEGTSNSAKERNPDRDYIELLQMLGITNSYQNKNNTDYSEPLIHLNKM